MSRPIFQKFVLTLVFSIGLVCRVSASPVSAVDSLLSAFSQHEDVATANRFLAVMADEGLTEPLPPISAGAVPDTLRKHVWFWATQWYFEQQKYEQALDYGRKAFPYFEEGSMEQADFLNTIACTYFRLGHFMEAAEHAKRGLLIEQKSGNDDIISSSMNTLAAIYLAAGQTEQAGQYILSALQHADRADNPGRKAILLGSATEIFHALGNDTLALDYADRACQLEQELGREPKLAIRRAQKSTALIGLKRYDEAEAELQAAIPVFRQVGNDQSLGIALNNLGKVAFYQGRVSEAVAYFRFAARLFAQMGDLYNELHSRHGLYESLWTLNPDSAKIELERFNSLKDSLYSHSTADALARYTAEFDNQRLMQENDKFRQEHRRDMLIAVAVLVLLALAFWGHYRRLRHRQRNLVSEIERLRMTLFAAAASEAGGVGDERSAEAVPEKQAEPTDDQRFLMHVIDVVNEALPTGEYGVEAIASRLNMSVQTFRRRLKAASDESPKAFILAIQMEKASKLLLSHPSLSVTDVARQCGFDEVSSFTHAFKRLFGLSPTQYREQGGQNGAK